MSMDYIRRTYGVPAKRGLRVGARWPAPRSCRRPRALLSPKDAFAPDLERGISAVHEMTQQGRFPPAGGAETDSATIPRPKFKLKAPEPTEAQAMLAVRHALRWHRAVAHVWRVNSGRALLPGKNGKERPVRFHDIPGCSDLIGILHGGRWLAVECKRPSTRKRATDEQLAFLKSVRDAGGVAFIAASADEAISALNAALAA